jgi:serine/threonine protein phosphatase PrpC
MLFPNEPGSGLQLWSSIGDFDLKSVNPVVSVYPYVRQIKDVSKGTQIIISSDGYTDFIDHKPLSDKWYTTIYKEVLKSKGNPIKLIEMARKRGSSDDITVVTYTI